MNVILQRSFCSVTEDHCRTLEFNPKPEGSNKEGKELMREADFQSGLVLTRPKAARFRCPHTPVRKVSLSRRARLNRRCLDILSGKVNLPPWLHAIKQNVSGSSHFFKKYKKFPNKLQSGKCVVCCLVLLFHNILIFYNFAIYFMHIHSSLILSK